MKTKIRFTLLFAVLHVFLAPTTYAQNPTREEIIKKREANLSRIVEIAEKRFQNGTLKQTEVLKARLGLLRFQRETASALTQKIAAQQKMVSVCETQQAILKKEQQLGLCDELEVLKATDELLGEQQLLAELNAKK